MKIDSLSLEEEEEEEEGLNRGRELKQFGLLRTNTLSISFGMHGYYQGLYLCVAVLSSDIRTYTPNSQPNKTLIQKFKKKVNSTPVDVCVFISFSLRFVFVFFFAFSKRVRRMIYFKDNWIQHGTNKYICTV